MQPVEFFEFSYDTTRIECSAVGGLLIALAVRESDLFDFGDAHRFKQARIRSPVAHKLKSLD